ncbi:MAG: hypothetical protein ABWK05_01110 [Pyrobaculum sp.]
MASYIRPEEGWKDLFNKSIKHVLYILFTRTGKALVGGGAEALDAAFREAEAALRKGGVVIIDEFQRLPPDYFDLVSSWPRSGVLIAAGSGRGVVEEMFTKGSPLLGLSYKIDIIAYGDVLAQLRDPVLSTIYRDPWVIPYVDSLEDLRRKTPQLLMVAKGLIGEVFSDEKREAAETYWKILLYVAEGRWKSTELAGLLALRGGLASVSSMLSKMAQMGLLRADAGQGEVLRRELAGAFTGAVRRG